MENYDLYVLGSLDSADNNVASEKLHARFKADERAFDLNSLSPLIALERARQGGMKIANNILQDAIDQLAASQEGFKPVIDALLHGKVLVDYLVDTRGGSVTHWVRTGSVFALIQQNGGLVRTYAIDKAFSLGAVNWSMGDERFACEHTRFMWHLPQYQGAQPEPLDERSAGITESIRSHMVEFFESIPVGAPWAEQIRGLKDQNEVTPSVVDLERAGFIERLFKHCGEVKSHISDGTPWQFTQDDNDNFLGPQLWYALTS